MCDAIETRQLIKRQKFRLQEQVTGYLQGKEGNKKDSGIPGNKTTCKGHWNMRNKRWRAQQMSQEKNTRSRSGPAQTLTWNPLVLEGHHSGLFKQSWLVIGAAGSGVPHHSPAQVSLGEGEREQRPDRPIMTNVLGGLLENTLTMVPR